MIDSTPLTQIHFEPTGGVNEVAAVTKVPLTALIEMENFRLSDDGARIEKRDGSASVATAATFGAKKIFAYHTYYDGTPAFCQLVVTEEKVWRKIAAGSWAAIHTWASTLDHPVRPLEIQDKQIIVTEIENIMILPDGTKVQLGITPPSTAIALAESYDSTLLDEDMAVITDWTDDDDGAGASTQATYDSRSTMKLLNTGSAGDRARRYRTVSNIGAKYTAEVTMYIATNGIYQDGNYFEIAIYNGRVRARVRIDTKDVYVYSGAYWVSAGYKPKEDEWVTWRIHVNTEDPDDEFAEVYAGNEFVCQLYVSDKDETNVGKVMVHLYGITVATEAYIDSIKIGDSSSGMLNGLYRYAVTFFRGGNYPNESNPLKSLIGTPSQTGSGTDDLTVSSDSSYTGSKDRTIRVTIDGTTPDTMKWSEDGGTTWNSTGIPLSSTMYLSYGVILAWASTTGHTLNDYWDISCDAFVAAACHQKVTITSIPVSSDAQVTARRIYRTVSGGTAYYLVATINDNTTTTFVDNIRDAVLGTDMREDHDIAPLGKYAEWWDDALWIADQDENITYHSRINYPDAFDISSRFVSARDGRGHDKITQILNYKTYLFVFKRHSIQMIRKKLTSYYGIYEVCKGYGAIAPWSVIEVYGLVMFLSHRGWEVFNGCSAIEDEFSRPILPFIKTIDKSSSKLEYISTGHLHSRSEVWLAIPDRKSSAADKVAVCNYGKGIFYYFDFPEVPSTLNEITDSSNDVQLVMGSRDGNVFTCDSGLTDAGTSISAKARIPWTTFHKYAQARLFEIEYELPADYNLTVNFYVNFEHAAQRTATFAGSTPATVTDRSIRLPIKNFAELGINGKYHAIKFTNAEAIGSDLKINWFDLYVNVFARKLEVEGN